MNLFASLKVYQLKTSSAQGLEFVLELLLELRRNLIWVQLEH